jgi:hypothetical protein
MKKSVRNGLIAGGTTTAFLAAGIAWSAARGPENAPQESGEVPTAVATLRPTAEASPLPTATIAAANIACTSVVGIFSPENEGGDAAVVRLRPVLSQVPLKGTIKLSGHYVPLDGHGYAIGDPERRRSNQDDAGSADAAFSSQFARVDMGGSINGQSFNCPPSLVTIDADTDPANPAIIAKVLAGASASTTPGYEVS